MPYRGKIINMIVSEESGRIEVFQAIKDLGPEELIESLENWAALLPDELRLRLSAVTSALAAGEDNLQRVLNLVLKQWEGLQAPDSIRVAVVGAAQTGKKTLVRNILQHQHPDDETFLSIIDIQGLDEFLGYGRQKSLPPEVADADVVLLVLDARFGFTEDTVQIVSKLSQLNKTFMVLLNKIDLAEKPRQLVKDARREFKVPVLPISALKSRSIIRLFKAIVAADSRTLYPLARRLPHIRKKICRSIVLQSAFGAGLVGAIPIPVSDIFPLLAIQTSMILKIARVFGFRIDRGRARELLPMFAAGLLIREGCHRLREIYPENRDLIAVGAGGTWTYLIGQVAVRYFEEFSGA